MNQDQSDSDLHREWRMARMAAMAFFFIITAYYVLKPIRESLAIELGSRQVPALNVLSMFSLVLANGLYSWIVGHFRRETFITWIMRGSGVCLVFFWAVFRHISGPVATFAPNAMLRLTAATTNVAWVDFFELVGMGAPLPLSRVAAITGYFIWVNLFGLFVVSVFWSFMNDVFTPQQGSRWYSRIGYGGLVGGLAGGVLTYLLVKAFGTPQLFLVAALLLEPALQCLFAIERLSRGQNAIAAPQAPPDTVGEPDGGGALEGIRQTFGSPYLMLMALEMFLYTFGSSIFSFQVNFLMEQTIPLRDDRTAYWAQLYNLINAFSLISQWAVTNWIMTSRRPWVGLALMPLVQFTGSLLLIPYPMLSLAAGISIVRYGLNYSTGRAVRELFFTPLDRSEKYQAKGFIDTFIFRSGDGLGSSLLLAGNALVGPGLWIDGSVLATMCLQILTTFWLGQAFLRRSQRDATVGAAENTIR